MHMPVQQRAIANVSGAVIRHAQLHADFWGDKSGHGSPYSAPLPIDAGSRSPPLGRSTALLAYIYVYTPRGHSSAGVSTLRFLKIDVRFAELRVDGVWIRMGRATAARQ